MSDIRDILGIPEDWPDSGTPEFWERFGCEGASEYQDCDAMSKDYARLRRLERAVASAREREIDPEDNEPWDRDAAYRFALDVVEALNPKDPS